MATIKIRRGSGQPAIGGSGLTAYEPAWDIVNNRFFINNGSTAMWIGAAVIQDTTLSGNCTWTIPTQNSVKTYVDNQVAAGAVTSVNGATGAVTITGGTGIAITTSLSQRGVTVGVASNVALLDLAQTFTAYKQFSAGISASGASFANDIFVNSLRIGRGSGNVNGNIAFGSQALEGNTVGNNNIAIGTQAIGNNSNGAGNVAIGHSSLRNLTSGYQNVALGNDTLFNTTSGIFNTAIGDQSLNLNTTGSNNTAVGSGSLTNNTTGVFNTAIGNDTLSGATGTYNIGIGNQAGAGGTDNIAIGNGNLSNMATGIENISIGKSSMGSGTTGSRNIAMGTNSLIASITGEENTGIGYLALESLISGNYNTTLGSQSLRGITAGSENVSIGYQSSNNILSATGGIFIGAGASGLTAGQTNEIVIGRRAVGFGSNTAVIGASAQSAAYIYGQVNAFGGVSAAGITTGSIRSTSAQTLTLRSANTNNTDIVLTGAATAANTIVDIKAKTINFGFSGVTAALSLNDGSGNNGTITIPSALTTSRTYNLPDSSGTIALTSGVVTGVTGTANQVVVTGNTGNVVIGLPSAITTPGSLTTTTSLSVGTNLTVTGNLTVNGTTTTVNSTTVTVQDPIIAIGGITGNAAPPVGDTKDRGIVFQWASASAGQTGFFGFDQSTQRFTFIPSGAAVSSEIVTGTAGIAEFSAVYAPQGTLTLRGSTTSNAEITVNGAATAANTVVDIKAKTINFGFSGVTAALSLNDGSGNVGTITVPSTLTGSRTYNLPDISGRVVLADTMGATSGWLLRGAGSSTVPTWINPQDSGFTAYSALGLAIGATLASQNFNLVFASGNSGYQLLYADTNNDIQWNPGTRTLTLDNGKGFLEGVVDGGAF